MEQPSPEVRRIAEQMREQMDADNRSTTAYVVAVGNIRGIHKYTVGTAERKLERVGEVLDALDLALLEWSPPAVRAVLVDTSPAAAAAEVPADLAPQRWTMLTNPTGGATVPVPMDDDRPSADLYRGDAEKTFDVEQAEAEGREYRAEEEAEVAAERAEGIPPHRHHGETPGERADRIDATARALANAAKRRRMP
jgi:hypothetical protein